MENKIILSLSLNLFLLSGCAHYYMPANHFVTPEAVGGKSHFGRLEWLGLQSGSDLTDPANTVAAAAGSTDAPTQELQKTWAHPTFSFSYALKNNLDLSLKIEPYAPLLLSLKYQFVGLPEDESKPGNFSMAIQASGGLMLGAFEGVSTSYYLLDGILVGGYRIAERHLAYLGPYFSLAGISGIASLSSTSANQYGACLGYQYRLESVFTRLELVWGLGGALGESKIKGFFGGAQVGFLL